MSEFTVARYSFTASVANGLLATMARLGEQADRFRNAEPISVMEDYETFLAHTEIADLRAGGEAEGAMSLAAVKIDQLAAHPLLAAAARAEGGDAFARAEAWFSGHGAQDIDLTAGDDLNGTHSGIIEAAITSGLTRLLTAERSMISNAVTKTLDEMGCVVDQATVETDGNSSIKAAGEYPGTSYLVRIEPRHNRISIHLAGFNGFDCSASLKRFNAGLKRHGLNQRIVSRRRHNDRSIPGLEKKSKAGQAGIRSVSRHQTRRSRR